ncbi:MAG: hypothetical protein E7496_03150 [Ruminococcus sp.]|nr:hypothetical protein [Ruminococcus sp.]
MRSHDERDMLVSRGRGGGIPFPVQILQILAFIVMITDARILGAVICIPTGILMLSQCHKSKIENPEEGQTEQYDPVGVVGGIGMLFFGICIILNYFFT